VIDAAAGGLVRRCSGWTLIRHAEQLAGAVDVALDLLDQGL
jgi:hypothetical protein